MPSPHEEAVPPEAYMLEAVEEDVTAPYCKGGTWVYDGALGGRATRGVGTLALLSEGHRRQAGGS